MIKQSTGQNSDLKPKQKTPNLDNGWPMPIKLINVYTVGVCTRDTDIHKRTFNGIADIPFVIKFSTEYIIKESDLNLTKVVPKWS